LVLGCSSLQKFCPQNGIGLVNDTIRQFRLYQCEPWMKAKNKIIFIVYLATLKASEERERESEIWIVILIRDLAN